MATTFNPDHFAALFQTGFLVNAAYLAIRAKVGSPVADYIKTERDIRLRLKPLSRDDVKTAKVRLAKDMRRSESILRFFLGLSSFSHYIALLVSFGLLVAAAFTRTKYPEAAMIGYLVVIFGPILLSMGTFSAVSALYLGQLERDIMGVAEAAGAAEDIRNLNQGATRHTRLKNAIEHLEGVLGGRG